MAVLPYPGPACPPGILGQVPRDIVPTVGCPWRKWVLLAPTPTPAPWRGFAGTRGRKRATAAGGGDRSPPGTFETQIGHGRYLKMPASSCRWLGWAGGGCWGPRRVWGAGLVVGGSPRPGPQPGPPQHPGAARNPRPRVHGAAGGNPGCPQTLRVPVSHDSPQPPSPQGTSWAASGYESFIRAGAHLRTLIAATQAWPWLGSWLPRKSVPERART